MKKRTAVVSAGVIGLVTAVLGFGEKVLGFVVPLESKVVRGKVVDDRGEPIQGAEVEVLSPLELPQGCSHRAPTDQHGAFTLCRERSGADIKFELEIKAGGCPRLRLPWTFDANRVLPITISCGAAAEKNESTPASARASGAGQKPRPVAARRASAPRSVTPAAVVPAAVVPAAVVPAAVVPASATFVITEGLSKDVPSLDQAPLGITCVDHGALIAAHIALDGQVILRPTGVPKSTSGRLDNGMAYTLSVVELDTQACRARVKVTRQD